MSQGLRFFAFIPDAEVADGADVADAADPTGATGATGGEAPASNAPASNAPASNAPTAPGPGGYVYLFVDVDGYCSGGIDQRTIVSRHGDGYRARELGWAYFTPDDHEAGSIYFCDGDGTAVPIPATDPSVSYMASVHGLPVASSPNQYADEAVMCSSRLLEAFCLLREAVSGATGRPVVFVHKGGNEGVWIARAMPGTPVIDIGALGCPKVDDIGRAAPELHVGKHCGHHAPSRRRAGKIIHCPRLEVLLMAGWISRCAVADGRWARARAEA